MIETDIPLWQVVQALTPEAGRQLLALLRRGVTVTCARQGLFPADGYVLRGRVGGRLAETTRHPLINLALVNELHVRLAPLPDPPGWN